jgi:hypothetical protein
MILADMCNMSDDSQSFLLAKRIARGVGYLLLSTKPPTDDLPPRESTLELDTSLEHQFA